MKKPFVVCHMFTSIEGKIDGAFMSDESALPSRAVYGNCAIIMKATPRFTAR